MPRGDRTGPMGMGPRSGRGMGFCSGYGMPGFMNRPMGAGFGAGYGGGRGWRHWFYATGIPGWMRFGGWQTAQTVPDPSAEKQALKTQAEFLKSELERINTRLDDLETPAGK